MFNENQVIAIVPTQANVLGEEHRVTPEQLARVIEAIESSGLADLIVVSSNEESLLEQAYESGAVNHEFDCIGKGSGAAFDLVSSLIDGVDTFIDEESWVAIINPTLSPVQVAEHLGDPRMSSQPVTVETLGEPIRFEFFKAGAISN